jgi:hypothetical protein
MLIEWRCYPSGEGGSSNDLYGGARGQGHEADLAVIEGLTSTWTNRPAGRGRRPDAGVDGAGFALQPSPRPVA